jgi:transposase InsO family protein
MRRSRSTEEQIIGVLREHDAGVKTADLKEYLFPSLAAARRIIEAWQTDYNTVGPHSSLGGLAPPPSLPTDPARGIPATERSYQRPENGEHVIISPHFQKVPDRSARSQNLD